MKQTFPSDSGRPRALKTVEDEVRHSSQQYMLTLATDSCKGGHDPILIQVRFHLNGRTFGTCFHQLRIMSDTAYEKKSY
jgi:hypothetical protein